MHAPPSDSFHGSNTPTSDYVLGSNALTSDSVTVGTNADDMKVNGKKSDSEQSRRSSTIHNSITKEIIYQLKLICNNITKITTYYIKN
jgi:hypothetical protein